MNRKVFALALVAALLPLLAMAGPGWGESRSAARAFMTFIIICLFTLPVMLTNGTSTFGVGAYLQLPLILLTCTLVITILRRHGWRPKWILLLTLVTYLISTATSNLFVIILSSVA